MKKRKAANAVMVAIIAVIVIGGVLVAGHIKGWFDRREDKYNCERYNAKCRHGASRMLKSNTVVYTGFDF